MRVHKSKIMSFLGPGLLSTLFIGGLIGFSMSAQAQEINLKFNTLPTKQGWTYEHANNILPEGAVFVASGGVLHQDTVTAGQFQQGGGDNLYRRNNVVSATNHFSITVKATFIDEALLNPNSRCGFGFGASTGTKGNDEYYGVCLDQSNVELAGLYGGVAIVDPPNAASFDKSKEHVYRLDVWPGMGAKLFVDGALVSRSGVLLTGVLFPSSIVPQLSLEFGDGTGGANAKVDISQFVYSEDRCSK